MRNRRWGVTPAVSLGIGERDSLIFAYLHQQQDDVLDTGIPFLDGRPVPVRRDARRAQCRRGLVRVIAAVQLRFIGYGVQ